MRWIVLIGVVLAACGGSQVPLHSGYKNDKSKPWKSAKKLKIDEKNSEFKADGDLNYAQYKRARWFALELPTHGTLTVKLEITPPGEAQNEDFDLGLEIYDPHFHIIGKSDKEDEDKGELTKTKTLVELEPGHYLIHLYLQDRMDTADFSLRGTFTTTKPAEAKTDFPAQVAFSPPLPMVPITDDTPASKIPKPVITQTYRKPIQKPTKPEQKPPTTIITARIIAVSVAGNGTRVTLGRGTGTGTNPTMHGSMKSWSFDVACTPDTCSGVIPASPDQVRGAGTTVQLAP